MMNLRKACALLLVGMMITTGLVAFSAPVLADEDVTITAGSGETYTAGFNTANMVDDPAIASGSEEPIIINEQGTGAADRLIYLGDEIQVQCQIWTSHAADPGYDVEVKAYSDNTLISIGDDDGDSFQTGAWADPITVAFDIVVGATGTVETAYNMHFRLTEDPGGANDAANIAFQIYVSSLWHLDDTDADRDSAMELPSIVDASGGDAPFEAGDTFKEARLTLNNDADFAVEEITGTVTSTDTNIVLYDDTARIPAGVAVGANAQFNYRIDVLPNTPPGDEYMAEFDCSYMRTIGGLDTTITESTLMSYFVVDFSFADDDPVDDGDLYSEFQCRATDVTITDDGEGNGGDGNATRQVDVIAPWDTYMQSTFSDKLITVEVTIENNGNTPIFNAEFELDPTGWPYFRNPRFFWTSAGTLSYDGILLSGIDLDIGESITFVIEVIVVKEIPIGEHRLPILYRGFYFNDGSTGDPTSYEEFNGGDDLQVIFSIFVEDEILDVAVTNVAMAGDGANKGDITAEVITVTVHNNEEYAFIDVLVVADFTGTPFYAPLIDTNTLDWPAPADREYMVDAQNANMYIPFAAWGADADMAVTFLVDTDPNMVPDRYPFTIMITAIIEETLEVVTTTVTIGAELNYVGYGALPVITAFTAEDIVPGQPFDLVLTIENVGDDTMRDVWVTIPHDGTDEYPWDIEQEFKEQFDWSNVFENWFDVTGPIEIPDGMFYTVEDLDVDNIREIIEINLYMEGVYSDPGSTIEVIHIIDLAPGASFEVTFEMFADKDMVNGKPYNVVVTITGIDSEGADVERTQTLEIWSSLPGDSYNPVELDWFDAGVKLLALVLFFIIVLAILLWVYNKFKGEPEEEEEDEFDFEDEPASFEEPPDKAPEELVTP